MKSRLTPRDAELLDVAYSTSYTSTLRRLRREAETETCRRIIDELITESTE